MLIRPIVTQPQISYNMVVPTSQGLSPPAHVASENPLTIIRKYLELIRFSHTLFALPFAALSAAMAAKLNFMDEPPIYPTFWEILGLLLCMVFARSAAMGFNRWADREIDAANPRTAGRHIPQGILSSKSVFLFTAFCSVAFVLSTLLFLPNRIPVAASVPVLLFLFGYSYAKRWTVAAHFWLGSALMLAPMAAWIVIRPILFTAECFVPLPPIFLGLAVLFWSTGFDLIYACQDAEFDAKSRLFSIPGRYGISTTFRIAAVCHLLAVLCFVAVIWCYEPFSWIFCVGVGVAAVILAAEHFIASPGRERPLDLHRVNIAFFQMNVVISLGLLVVGLIDLF